MLTPFGLQMSGQHFTNTDLLNKFLYNGKELQDQTGYYDYGFRQMDPALGRWFVTDALAESYASHSPYAYVLNNPINSYDILGLAVSDWENPGFSDDVWNMITWAGQQWEESGADEFSISGADAMQGAGVGEYAGSGGSGVSSSDVHANSFGGKLLSSGFVRNVLDFLGYNVSPYAGGYHLSWETGDPPWHIHHVNEGETLYSISQRYSVSMDNILEANPNIRFRRGSTGQLRPEIYPYNPKKPKPWKWQGDIPPSWYVTQIVIPQPQNTTLSPLADIGLPGVWAGVPLVIGFITGSPNAPHLYSFGGMTPGQGQQNRAYYNAKLGSYFEWQYTNSAETSMQILLFDGYEKRNGTWRGTHRHADVLYGDLLPDGSWKIYNIY